MNKLSALMLVCSMTATGLAQAGAIRDLNLFTGNTLTANDDKSTGLIDLGFNIDFFGLQTSQLYVNNNGNVTFDSAMDTFTPFGLQSTNRQLLAPFFADVDTRHASSGVVQFGQNTINGLNVFGVNWFNVGYYNSSADKLNQFQLIITDRSDVHAGDFDFEFNYDQILWETGSAASSGGTGGLGGNSARVGWSNGNVNSFELSGSAINGALLDSGNGALVDGSLNSSVAGRYVFNVRNGVVQPPSPVSAPGSMMLMATAFVAFAMRRRRKV
jgi:hypothetical protein